MAEYFIECPKCEAMYHYRPKVKGNKAQITVVYDGLATNADIPQTPKCPKCGTDGEWVVLMG